MLGGEGLQRRPRRDVGYPGAGRRRSSRSSKWLRPEDGEGSGNRARTPRSGLDCPLVAGGCDLKAPPTPRCPRAGPRTCLPPGQLSPLSSILPVHQKVVCTSNPWVLGSELATALPGPWITILTKASSLSPTPMTMKRPWPLALYLATPVPSPDFLYSSRNVFSHTGKYIDISIF